VVLKPAERIHTIEIPINGFSLLVPTAGTAEVVNVAPLTTIPFGPVWQLGAIGWRAQAIPILSFEALIGAAPGAPVAGSKIVVFYPLKGCREWEFFGILSASEPRPHTVDQGLIPAGARDLPDTPYVAAGLKVDGRFMVIPDMEALSAVFYAHH
jgi:chemosensory pili system protein ChpC